MIKVRPYQQGDVFHVEPMEKEWDAKEQEYIALNNIAYTVFNDEKIIGIFGFSRILEGTYHFWSMLSEDIRKFPIATVKIARAAIQSLQARRVQMTTVTENEAATSFAYRMGFTLEGVLKKYGPDGRDHYLFSKVAA